MMHNKRLPFDANSLEEVLQYWKTRSRQIAYAGFNWTGEVKKESFGYSTSFLRNEKIESDDDTKNVKEHGKETDHIETKKYVSGFVLLDKRSQGLFLPWLKSQEHPIVTTHSCNLAPYFNKVGFSNFLIPELPEVWPEYQLAEKFYKDGQAKRSKAFFMNHIDEALLVMQKSGANLEAQKAFCLHPIFQIDNDLGNNYDKVDYSQISPKALLCAIEYRSVANEYLSHRTINSIDEIRLSPLKEVNDMLIGDKVQNYKDFLLYHKNTHPRSDKLEKYFHDWLTKLRCSEMVEWLMSQPFETFVVSKSIDNSQTVADIAQNLEDGILQDKKKLKIN